MTTPTLLDQIAAVNAYADFIEQPGTKPFTLWDRDAMALSNAAYAALAATETWTVLDETDPRNVRLQAPDGTHVLLSAHLYGNNGRSVKRLTRVEQQGE